MSDSTTFNGWQNVFGQVNDSISPLIDLYDKYQVSRAIGGGQTANIDQQIGANADQTQTTQTVDTVTPETVVAASGFAINKNHLVIGGLVVAALVGMKWALK